MTNIRCIDPAGYLDFLQLMACAKLMLTDSGGIQEETTVLEVPCLTLRENTERPVTAKAGFNHVTGTNPEKILAAYKQALAPKTKRSGAPPLWDGQAASRIAQIVANTFCKGIQRHRPGAPTSKCVIS
jgi:UDP-N-acetylglucosamine 2-epimerase (non-hydrolysing)